MRRLLIVVSVSALIVALAAGCGGSHPKNAAVTGRVDVRGAVLAAFTPGQDDPAQDAAAPQLTGTDFGGRTVRIADPADRSGKAIVFLTHWCDACETQAKDLAQWMGDSQRPKNISVSVVMTASDAQKPKYPPATFLANNGLGSVTTLVDSAAGDAARAYGITEYPTWVMVRPNNTVLARLRQPFTADLFPTLFNALAALSNGGSLPSVTNGTTTEPPPTEPPPTEPPPTEPPPTEPPPTEPPTQPAPVAIDVEALIGEPVDGPVVTAFLDAVACKLDYHMKCMTKGIEVSLGGSLRVESVFLYAEGVFDYSAYTGPIPYGLRWGTSRADVEAQLGAPVNSGDLKMYEQTHFSVYNVSGKAYKTLTLDFTLGDGSAASQQLKEVVLTKSAYQPLP